MKFLIRIFASFTVSVLLISCDELSKRAEGKVNAIINDKAEQLDSIVNSEVNSIIGIDSLVNEASSNLDSIKSKKAEILEILEN